MQTSPSLEHFLPEYHHYDNNNQSTFQQQEQDQPPTSTLKNNNSSEFVEPPLTSATSSISSKLINLNTSLLIPPLLPQTSSKKEAKINNSNNSFAQQSQQFDDYQFQQQNLQHNNIQQPQLLTTTTTSTTRSSLHHQHQHHQQLFNNIQNYQQQQQQQQFTSGQQQHIISQENQQLPTSSQTTPYFSPPQNSVHTGMSFQQHQQHQFHQPVSSSSNAQQQMFSAQQQQHQHQQHHVDTLSGKNSGEDLPNSNNTFEFFNNSSESAMTTGAKRRNEFDLDQFRVTKKQRYEVDEFSNHSGTPATSYLLQQPQPHQPQPQPQQPQHRIMQSLQQHSHLLSPTTNIGTNNYHSQNSPYVQELSPIPFHVTSQAYSSLINQPQTSGSMLQEMLEESSFTIQQHSPQQQQGTVTQPASASFVIQQHQQKTVSQPLQFVSQPTKSSVSSVITPAVTPKSVSTAASPSHKSSHGGGSGKKYKFKAYVPKVEAPKSFDDEEDVGQEYNKGPWTKEEHELFLRGYRECGRQWKHISEQFVKTRDRRQVSSHAQKHFQKLKEQESNKSSPGVKSDIVFEEDEDQKNGS